MGILRDILSAGLGSNLGTRDIKRELEEQTELMKKEESDRKAAEKREMLDRFYESCDYRYYRSQVIKENQERRRKGQPELPVPPWKE